VLPRSFKFFKRFKDDAGENDYIELLPLHDEEDIIFDIPDNSRPRTPDHNTNSDLPVCNEPHLVDHRCAPCYRDHITPLQKHQSDSFSTLFMNEVRVAGYLKFVDGPNPYFTDYPNGFFKWHANPS
jgi:hypothetical protein